MKKIYTEEMKKLAEGLVERGIAFTFIPIYEGCQIVVKDTWDAVCHEFSYGGKHGLLEVMGTIVRNKNDDVEGYLTAEDILKRLD